MKNSVPELQEARMSRREALVVAGIGVGYALAVQPVMAQTAITTSSDGLNVGDVKVKTDSGDMPAYRAMPASGTGFPVVIVVPEIFGLHTYVRDVCRRFAKLGYYAIAVDQYFRIGDPTKLPDGATIFREIVLKAPDARIMLDFDAAAAFAKTEGADSAKLGITGFCQGGRYVWLYAAHNPALKAGVAWYGHLKGGSNEVRPKAPIDVVGQIKPPVLGLYGGTDASIPADQIEEMKKGLAATGNKSEFVVYPNAGHAFHADYRPQYNKDAAEDGWKRALAWFKANGVG